MMILDSGLLFWATLYMYGLCVIVAGYQLHQWCLQPHVCVCVKQWFSLFCPTRTTASQCEETVAHPVDTSLQLDVAKVFKGRMDKK